MEDIGLDGLKHILETHVAPDNDVQLQKSLTHSNIAARVFKEDRPPFVQHEVRTPGYICQIKR